MNRPLLRVWWVQFRVFCCLLVILLVATAALSVAAPAPTAKRSDPAVKRDAIPVRPAPVVLDGETLFTIKERILSITPETRARLISERFAKLSDDPSFRPELMKTVDDEAATNIVSGDYFIIAVTDQDAAAEGKNRRELAEEYVTIVRTAIEAHRKAVQPDQLFHSALYAAGATMVLVVLAVVLLKLFHRIMVLIESRLAGHGLRFKSYEIIKEQHIRAVLSGIINLVRVMVFAILVIAYLQVVLNLFPWTRSFAHHTLELFLGPLRTIGTGIAHYIPNLFFIAVLVVLTHYLLRFIRFIFTEIDSGVIAIPGFYRDWAWPTFNIIRLLVIAFVTVVAFPYIPGSESPAFKGVSLFVGVLFSLGSTSAIGSIVAGTILTYMRPFVVGDRVKIGETVGDVIEKSLLVTRIRTIKNVEITVPNSQILGVHIVNYSMLAKAHGLILHTTVTIGYDAPWRTVHELLIAAARATNHLLTEPPPFVFQTALNDFYVAYEINATTDKPNLMDNILSELHTNIQEKFNEAGLEIMSPHYSQLRDGNTVTIPEAYRPADYTPASFRFRQTKAEE